MYTSKRYTILFLHIIARTAGHKRAKAASQSITQEDNDNECRRGIQKQKVCGEPYIHHFCYSHLFIIFISHRQILWATAEPPHIVVGNPKALQRLVDMVLTLQAYILDDAIFYMSLYVF